MSAPRLRTPGLSLSDVLRVGLVGLRTRPVRAVLSALGIAIGIAAMISVIGISTSSRAELDRALESLGTDLLTVSPGQTFTGGSASLPLSVVPMISRIAPVHAVSAAGTVPDAAVYRTDLIPELETGGLSVVAARLDLPDTVGAAVRDGAWLNASTAQFPTVVLGSAAAARLGVVDVRTGTQVYLADRWFTVVGVLHPVVLAPELDSTALVGWSAAERYLEFDGHPTTVYTRSDESSVDAVRGMLGPTANPEHPNEVQVSRPSEALEAQRATDRSFTGLLLGVVAVALLVGGVGVANTMVISVLERRTEIGLRRSLGATGGHIRTQFLTESLLLSLLGGAAGVALGAAVTTGYAASQSWPAVVPPWAIAGGVGATVLVGMTAGLYPAVRASRMSPMEALARP